MAAPWVVSCSCGWVAVAETLNEAVALVEAHADRREEPTLHVITIRGAMNPEAPRRPPAIPRQCADLTGPHFRYSASFSRCRRVEM